MKNAADLGGAPNLPRTDKGFLAPFLQLAAANPDRIYARARGSSLTFGALDQQSARIAARLRAEGIEPGVRVALMLRNSDTTIAILFAIARAGGVWVPINPEAVGDNLAYVLSHAAPRVAVVESDLLPILEACGAHLACVTIVTVAALCEQANEGPITSYPSELPHADAPFAIMYTSGTTGRPKGVMVSHRMLRLSGEAVALVSAAKDGDVFYVWEPLFHIGGAQMIVLPLIRAATLVIADRFSARSFWSDLQSCGATHLHFLGGVLQILLKQPPGPLDRAHGVRIAWGGGCPREIWRNFEARFGVEIRECYGMTECSSVTTANLDGTIGSVGKPLPWFDVRIVNSAGDIAAVGERGELIARELLKGALTAGYFNDIEATAKAFRNGAFHTGDLASRDDDGNMYFHGRMTDSVRVRGENVAASEVEDVARKHPAIEDCVMIGVAADVGESEIKLFVKVKASATLSPKDLSAWLAQNLARYQRPRYIVMVDEFERTPSQRIMKHKLSRRTDDAWDVAADS